jgi:alpha-tubulin suppressor-like RCC1 family protein
VFAWGSDRHGCLGLGAVGETLAPTMIAGLEGVVSIDCDNDTSAAVLDTGALMMWGCNARGRLGTGDDSDRPIPTAIHFPNGGFGGAGGSGGGSGSESGGGFGGAGGSGSGSGSESGGGGGATSGGREGTAVVHVSVAVVHVSVGSLYTGAVTADGGVWTWGYGGHGNLGHGNRKSKCSWLP